MIEGNDLCFSSDREIFTDDFDSACDDIEFNLIEGDKATLYIGTSVPRTHKDFLNLTALVEDMVNRAYDDSPEFCENYLTDITSESAEHLEKIILDWMNKNVRQPTFWGVTDVKVINYVVGKRDEIELPKR